MSLLPANAPLAGVGAHGLLGLVMGALMSSLRVRSLSSKTLKVTSPVFKHWHNAQLNQAEYNPLFMGLYVGVYLSRQTGGAVPDWAVLAGDVGVASGVLGSILFIFGCAMQPVGVEVKSPPFFRAVGALTRYVSVLALSVGIIGACL